MKIDVQAARRHVEAYARRGEAVWTPAEELLALLDAVVALDRLASYDFHATQHIAGLQHDGHDLRAIHTEDVDALIADVNQARTVLAPFQIGGDA